MREFYIELAQGIITSTRSGSQPFSVRTSTLYSCSLICVHNITTGRGGAFHYPAGRISDPVIVTNLTRFLELADPSEVVIIYPPEDRGMISNAADHRALEQWIRQQVECAPTTVNAVSGGLVIDTAADAGTMKSRMRAGRLLDIGLNGDLASAIKVKHRAEGRYSDYGEFQLIGTAE